jgi:hypothetical protein
VAALHEQDNTEQQQPAGTLLGRELHRSSKVGPRRREVTRDRDEHDDRGRHRGRDDPRPQEGPARATGGRCVPAAARLSLWRGMVWL